MKFNTSNGHLWLAWTCLTDTMTAPAMYDEHKKKLQRSLSYRSKYKVTCVKASRRWALPFWRNATLPITLPILMIPFRATECTYQTFSLCHFINLPEWLFLHHPWRHRLSIPDKAQATAIFTNWGRRPGWRKKSHSQSAKEWKGTTCQPLCFWSDKLWWWPHNRWLPAENRGACGCQVICLPWALYLRQARPMKWNTSTHSHKWRCSKRRHCCPGGVVGLEVTYSICQIDFRKAKQIGQLYDFWPQLHPWRHQCDTYHFSIDDSHIDLDS